MRDTLGKRATKIAEIQKCQASQRKGIINIECENEIPENKIRTIVENYDYRFGQQQSTIKSKNTSRDYLQILIILIIGIIIFIWLRKIDITHFFPSFDDQVNIFIAFLLGIIALLSIYLALIGGIVLSFGNMYPTRQDKNIISDIKYFHILNFILVEFWVLRF